MSLRKKRTTEGFIERLASSPKNSRENIQAAVNNFIKFTKEAHGYTVDQIYEELIFLKKTKGEEEFEHELYGLFQDWIDWNVVKKQEHIQLEQDLA